jgi:hypothetical protein
LEMRVALLGGLPQATDKVIFGVEPSLRIE